MRINIRVEWHAWIDVWLSSSHLPLILANSKNTTSFSSNEIWSKYSTHLNQSTKNLQNCCLLCCTNSMTGKFKLLLNSKQLLLPANSCNNITSRSMLDFLFNWFLWTTFDIRHCLKIEIILAKRNYFQFLAPVDDWNSNSELAFPDDGK